MKNKKLKKNIWEYGKAIGIGLCIALFIRTFFFSMHVVSGESMEPTLQNGNFLAVNKFQSVEEKLERFDVIVHEREDGDYNVKRVVGIPGDTIEYRDNVLYVNGEATEEPYLKEDEVTANFTLMEKTGENHVPEGHVFVVGDNRNYSTDSRVYGFVKMEQIVGEVDLRLWPLTKISTKF
ncbi:signal peptidase I [Priestia taiwanensis]|uniref:Signal peptidase I n=1 Tax=Priestia taiwanensis TaxID=1347902 RepID=A0A917AUZ5_9BACI|nr:signal peptidase I [Priestia taiwanensis]MBM7364223.1 signal peptidase I [Priestia taiwanensis]GGE72653.1 signal peptidase I [Priestia taiwanensis]